ncbi:MAG: hypothetical protein OXN89_13965, partial [Bryobacterales bacterium]|nr:hypothetical protein [Bryobacterales bacterium]
NVRVSDNLTEVLEMLEQEPRTWADRIRAEERAEMQRSMVAMLLEMAKLRFGGGAAERLAKLLDGISDTNRLKDIAKWVVVCESGEALLARLRRA